MATKTTFIKTSLTIADIAGKVKTDKCYKDSTVKLVILSLKEAFEGHNTVICSKKFAEAYNADKSSAKARIGIMSTSDGSLVGCLMPELEDF